MINNLMITIFWIFLIINYAITVSFYKIEATVISEDFLAQVLAEDLKEREGFLSRQVHDEMKSIKSKNFLDILKGAAGSFLFVILTGDFYLAVWSLSVSPKMIAEKVFNVQIISS